MWSIVVAGGSGRRFGEPKQFSVLAGRPVLAWAVDACRAVSDGVVVVVPADTDTTAVSGADAVVTGGATRADSVRHGLDAVPTDADVVLVHDAARPLATPELFAAILGALVDDDIVADGVVPGLAPSDTIKVVDEAMNVTSTLDRTTLVAVQTPQVFRAPALRAAHQATLARPGPPATDDAMLVEAIGGRIRVVPGDAANIKITTPDDLETAERLLAQREA